MEQQDIDIINKEVKKQTFKNYIIENKKKNNIFIWVWFVSCYPFLLIQVFQR